MRQWPQPKKRSFRQILYPRSTLEQPSQVFYRDWIFYQGNQNLHSWRRSQLRLILYLTLGTLISLASWPSRRKDRKSLFWLNLRFKGTAGPSGLLRPLSWMEKSIGCTRSLSRSPWPRLPWGCMSSRITGTGPLPIEVSDRLRGSNRLKGRIMAEKWNIMKMEYL